MKQRPGTAFLLIYTAVCLLLGSCSRAPTKEIGISDANLVIAVWDGAAAERTMRLATAYSKMTGRQVSVITFPEWQFGGMVNARLLAGTSPWDVIYVKGEWVPELSRDHTLMDLTGLLEPEQAEKMAVEEFSRGARLFGLAVDGNIPFLFYRKDQIPTAILTSFDTPSHYMNHAGQIELPPGEYPAGAALGGQDSWLGMMPFASFVAHSQYGLPDLSLEGEGNIRTLLDTFCSVGTSSVFHPDSIGWGQGDLVQALRDGRIASAVIWNDPGIELITCEKDGPACKDGKSLIGFQLFPSGGKSIPRLMNAWVVPGQEKHAEKAAGWLRWVSSPEGVKIWQDLGGIPLGNEKEYKEIGNGLSISESVQSIFYSVDPAIGPPGSADLQASFTSYFNDCRDGRLSPEEFLARYSLDVSRSLKQRDKEP